MTNFLVHYFSISTPAPNREISGIYTLTDLTIDRYHDYSCFGSCRTLIESDRDPTELY